MGPSTGRRGEFGASYYCWGFGFVVERKRERASECFLEFGGRVRVLGTGHNLEKGEVHVSVSFERERERDGCQTCKIPPLIGERDVEVLDA
jgi:hypothetical protein